MEAEGQGGMSCAKARWRRMFQGEGTAYGKFKNSKTGSVWLECGVEVVNAREAGSGSRSARGETAQE